MSVLNVVIIYAAIGVLTGLWYVPLVLDDEEEYTNDEIGVAMLTALVIWPVLTVCVMVRLIVAGMGRLYRMMNRKG